MERTEEDSYLTLAEPAEALYKEKGSKFLAYAYPVSSEEQIRECLEALRKRYYDADASLLRVEAGSRRSELSGQ